MRTINSHEAKIRLSQLVEAATRGWSFVFGKAGKPQVIVTAIVSRRFGFLIGQRTGPDSFDCMVCTDIDEMFKLR